VSDIFRALGATTVFDNSKPYPTRSASSRPIQTASTTQPRFAVSLERVPAHPRVQVDFSLGSTGLQVLDDPRTILLDLLLNLDGTSAIHEVASLKGECFEDSHACGRKQDVKRRRPIPFCGLVHRSKP